jgi:hypothetical protein
MLARWPGCFVPPLPPKKMLGVTPEFIQERCTHLNTFCQEVAKRSHLFNSDEFQAFLRDRDLESALSNQEPTKPQSLSDRYSKAFAECKGEAEAKQIAELSMFSAFLKKSAPSLDPAREAVQALIAAAAQDSASQNALFKGLVLDLDEKMGKFDAEPVLGRHKD